MLEKVSTITITTKLAVYKAIALPPLLCGSETWAFIAHPITHMVPAPYQSRSPVQRKNDHSGSDDERKPSKMAGKCVEDE